MTKHQKYKKNNKKPAKKRESLKTRGGLLYGIHACTEALKNPARNIHAIYVADKIWNGDKRAQTEGLIAEVDAAALPAPKFIDKDFLDNVLGRHTVHQHIAIDTDPLEENFLSDLIIKSKTRDKTTLVMLDHVTDPHNIGAILRSTAAFGAQAIIGQTRHMPDMNSTIAKIACGAVEHVPIVQEKNLSETLEKLIAEGFTCIGLSEHTDMAISDVPKSNKTVIVLGAEGKGIRPKILETCTHRAKLPTQPPIASLNVSNAAAIALYAVCS